MKTTILSWLQNDDPTIPYTSGEGPIHIRSESHHPIHIWRGLACCLYKRVRKVTTSLDSLRREEKHLESVLKWNGYPAPFIRDSSTPPSRSPAVGSQREQSEERSPLVMLPYVRLRREQGHQACMQSVQPQSDLQVWTDVLHHTDQGQGQTSRGEVLQGCLLDSL